MLKVETFSKSDSYKEYEYLLMYVNLTVRAADLNDGYILVGDGSTKAMLHFFLHWKNQILILLGRERKLLYF